MFGIVENFSSFICPTCGTKSDIFQVGGGEKICKEFNLPLLGKIPLDERISGADKTGVPFVMAHPDSPAGKVFIDIAKKILKDMEERGTLKVPPPKEI